MRGLALLLRRLPASLAARMGSRRRFVLRLVLSLVIAASGASSVEAQSFYWRTPAGGSWSDPANWFLTTEAGFPDDGGDVPTFGLNEIWEGNVPGGAPISFDRSLTTNSLGVIGGDYRFDLNGNTYSPGGLFVSGSGNDGPRDASLVVEDGTLLTGGTSTIGGQGGRSGSVTLTGPLTSWEAGELRMATAGSGSLLLDDGAFLVVDDTLSVAFGNPSGTGAGSLGSLEIANGAHLSAGFGPLPRLGLSIQPTQERSGRVIVRDGGQVETAGVVLRGTNTAISSIMVTGAGSTFLVRERPLIVNPRSLFLVEAGGSVESESDALVLDGTLQVTGADSRLDVSGHLSLTRNALVPVLQGAQLRASAIDLSGGTLRVDDGSASVGGPGGTPPTGSVKIGGDGAVSGAGTVEADVINAGVIAPEVITIDGNYEQDPLGRAEFEISGLIAGTDFDQLDVTGNVLLDGRLSLVFKDLFAPSQGDTFDLVLFGGALQGEWSQVDITGLLPGFEYDLQAVGNAVRLTALNDALPIPEAGTAPLLGLGLLALAWRNRFNSAVGRGYTSFSR